MTAAPDEWDRLADALDYPANAAPSAQERYVATFDLDEAATLDIGWHLYGETPDRCAFLAVVREELERLHIVEGCELPDHLPTLLRLIAREDDQSAAKLAGLIAPVVDRLRDRLAARGSPFAETMDAVARLLATVRASEEQT